MAGTGGSAPKQYGLILPKKAGASAPVATRLKPMAFADDDDDDDDSRANEPRNLGEAIKRDKFGARMKLETQSAIHNAIAENPDAFEYDKVYDQIQEKKAELLGRAKGKDKDKDRKPKYIHALLKASKDREKDYERWTERKIQREREAEGNQFEDKEAFVTSAYKKKMQEQREAEAREKALAEVEAKLDVTKQGDMRLFYKHMLKQQTGEEKVKNADEAWSVIASNDGKSAAVSSSSKSKAQTRRSDSESSSDERINKKLRRTPSRSPSPSSSEPREATPRETSPRPSSSKTSEQVAENPSLVIRLPEKSKLLTLAEQKALELEKRTALFAKRSTEESTQNARERYLARQAAKQQQQTSSSGSSAT